MKNALFLCLLAIVLPAAAPLTLQAQLGTGTYVIGPSPGDDYLTISAAVADMASGISGPVTFRIRDGVYNEQVFLNAISGVSATNTITFEAYDTILPHPLIEETPGPGDAPNILEVRSTDYVTFRNLVFATNATVNGFENVVDLVLSDDIRFEGCTFNGSGTDGTLVRTLDNGGLGPRNANLVLLGNTFNEGNAGLDLEADGTRSPGIVLEGNLFENQQSIGLAASDLADLEAVENEFVSGPSSDQNYTAASLSNVDGVFERNIVDAPDGYRAASFSNVYSQLLRLNVANNMFTVSGTDADFGVLVEGYVDFYYNTIRLDTSNPAGIGLQVQDGGTATPEASLLNNIVVNVDDGTAYELSDTATILDSDHNNYYSLSGNTAAFGATTYAGLADFQQASGTDTSSVSVAVTFADGPNGDLHLAGSSQTDPSLGGIPLASVTTDFDGDSRDPVRPYMGVDEGTAIIHPLNGLYEISGTGDYATFSEAVADLKARGVSGAVTFQAVAGTYNENISLSRIEGASAASGITFTKKLLIATVELQHAATGAADNAVVRLNGAKHVTIAGLTLTATGADFGRVLTMVNGASDIVIRNSTLNGIAAAGELLRKAVVFVDDSEIGRVTLENNTINNGSHGYYHIDDQKYDAQEVSLIDNTFLEQYANGVRAGYHEDLILSGNRIERLTLADSEDYAGVRLDFTRNALLDQNTIITKTGVGIEAGIEGATVESSAMDIRNNMVAIQGPDVQGAIRVVAGIKVFADDVDVRHNTVWTTEGSSVNAGVGIEFAGGANNTLERNIINSGPGFPLRVADYSVLSNSDYNAIHPNAIDEESSIPKDLDAWNSLTGWDANSVVEDVSFVSLTAPQDLHLAVPSDGDPALGAPLDPEILVDIDGEGRLPTTYMGADQASPLAPLCGVYTIDGSGGANYNSFTEAVDDLTAVGISCPVAFTVAAGTYAEQLTIGSVPGVSSADSVLFLSVLGPVVQYAPAGAPDNWVVKLDGTSHVAFIGIQFENTSGSDFGRIIELQNASHIQFEATDMTGTAGAASEDGSLVYGHGTLNEHNRFFGGVYTGGFRAIDLESVDSANRSDGNVVAGGIFDNQTRAAVRLRHQTGSAIRGTTVTDGADSGSNYVGLFTDGSGAVIERNRVIVTEGSTGIRMGSNGGGQVRRRVVNNMVSLKGANAERAFYTTANLLDVYHNSFAVADPINTPASATVIRIGSGADDVDIKNNLLQARHSGYVSYVETGTTNITSDYNNFYQHPPARGPIGHWQGTDAANFIDFITISTGAEFYSTTIQIDVVSFEDLHLTGSAVGNTDLAGTPLPSVPLDFDEEPRNTSAPYKGADEAEVLLAPDALELTLTLLLEGAYTGAPLMTASLVSDGHIPNDQPYDGAAWGYTGTESADASFYTAHPDIIDWILVRLRSGDPVTSMTVEASRAAFLLDDGSVIDMDGTGPLLFSGLDPDSYWIEVIHRNHLAVMSAAAVDMSTGSAAYDFTTAATQSYGGATGVSDVGGAGTGPYGLVSGDADADGNVFPSDLIDYWIVQSGSSGYLEADFDLDGNVFPSDLIDAWIVNSGKSSQVPEP